MPSVTQFNQGKQNGSITPPPSPPFKLNGNIYRTQVETAVTDGNIKSSAIQLQKEVITKSGKTFVTYATSNDGGKTWLNGSGGKGSSSLSTDSGLTADEVKGLQPGGNLNKETAKAANQSAIKAGASKTQQNQLKAGNDANAQNPPEPTFDAEKFSGSKEGKAKTGTRANFNQKGTLIYPTDIGATKQDIIKFDMLKYEPGKFDSKTFGFSSRERDKRFDSKFSIGTVILPIPSGISDTNSCNWSGAEMNALQAGLANIALTTIQEGVGEGVDETGKILNTIRTNSGDVGTAVAAAMAGNASGAAGLLTRTTGSVINPNLELLFQSPVLRTFGFTFKMSARSEPEAKTIIAILRFFKQGMSAQRSESNLFLKTPHTFGIRYMHRGQGGEEHKYIGKIKECALTSFTVNYTPEGQYATFYDGPMVSYEMQMQFQELEPIFNNDYGENDFDNIGF